MNTYTEFKRISDLISSGNFPKEPKELNCSVLNQIFEKMSSTAQDIKYHAEGDVYTHTSLVCQRLTELDEYKELDGDSRIILYWAAMLHDIGKIRCTVLENGDIKSPYHSKVGSRMARELLWKELGLCGDAEKQRLREAICLLIRYHSFPPYAMASDDCERRILKIAANSQLTSGFSLDKLCILEKADILGRISKDTEASLDKIEYCRLFASETGCLYSAYPFPSDFSMRAYFKGRSGCKDLDVYDDSWGKVILLSGLPGTGKDTFIKARLPDLPMVSLDEIRRAENISPTENQSRVAYLACEQAKEYLRKKQAFVWNATNITPRLREMQISMFEDYKACVETIFLETEWHEELIRNAGREKAVPVSVIEKMLAKLEIPERSECQSVNWMIL